MSISIARDFCCLLARVSVITLLIQSGKLQAAIVLLEDNSRITNVDFAVLSGELTETTLFNPNPLEDSQLSSFLSELTVSYDAPSGSILVGGRGTGELITSINTSAGDAIYSMLFQVTEEQVTADVSFRLSSAYLFGVGDGCDAPFQSTGLTSISVHSLSGVPTTALEAGISSDSDGDIDGASCGRGEATLFLDPGIYRLEARTHFVEELGTNDFRDEWATFSVEINFDQSFTAIPLPGAGWFLLSAISGIGVFKSQRSVKKTSGKLN